MTEMTPVQTSSLPAILAGRDVVAQARTGSGKTAAFALGLLSALDATSGKLQGLVLCPTRELADQVSREIRRLARFIPNVKVLTLCGGVPLRPHLASLSHEPQYRRRHAGPYSRADPEGSTAAQGHRCWCWMKPIACSIWALRTICAAFSKPRRTQRQTLLFSATIPQSIREISRELQRDPLDITLRDEPDETTIEQTFFEVEGGAEAGCARSAAPAVPPGVRGGVLQHSRGRPCGGRGARRSRLRGAGPAWGARSTRTRGNARALRQSQLHGPGRLRRRGARARYHRPSDGRSTSILLPTADTHLHRIGRTGRAGRRGVALSLCLPRESNRANLIEDRLGEPLQWGKPTLPLRLALPLLAPFVTIAVDAGRQHKLRPGDLLGALYRRCGNSSHGRRKNRRISHAHLCRYRARMA